MERERERERYEMEKAGRSEESERGLSQTVPQNMILVCIII